MVFSSKRFEIGRGGIFVCKLVTSIKTSITSFGNLFFFMKLMKSVASLRFMRLQLWWRSAEEFNLYNRIALLLLLKSTYFLS